MYSELTPKEMDAIKNRAVHGGKAKDFEASEPWVWFKNSILKALEDEAVQTLRLAKDDADRLKAQQMFLASRKPGEMLENLIRQGDAAIIELQQISTQEGETNA